MHRLFEQVADRTEIMPRLQQMRRNGLLSDNEAQQVQALLDKALDDPLIASWFDSPLERRTERKYDSRPERPDRTATPTRVLTRGTEAVVIDYKFGRKKRTAHTRQIEAYMRAAPGYGIPFRNGIPVVCRTPGDRTGRSKRGRLEGPKATAPTPATPPSRTNSDKVRKRLPPCPPLPDPTYKSEIARNGTVMLSKVLIMMIEAGLYPIGFLANVRELKRKRCDKCRSAFFEY